MSNKLDIQQIDMGMVADITELKAITRPINWDRRQVESTWDLYYFSVNILTGETPNDLTTGSWNKLPGGLEKAWVLPAIITSQWIYTAEWTELESTLPTATGSQDRVMIVSTGLWVWTTFKVLQWEKLNWVVDWIYVSQWEWEVLMFIDSNIWEWSIQVTGIWIVDSLHKFWGRSEGIVWFTSGKLDIWTMSNTTVTNGITVNANDLTITKVGTY